MLFLFFVVVFVVTYFNSCNQYVNTNFRRRKKVKKADKINQHTHVYIVRLFRQMRHQFDKNFGKF